MTATLFFSVRCQHCVNLLNYIQNNPPLHHVSQFIDVNKQRIPQDMLQKIDSVPALVTDDGQILSGKELKKWYESMMPCDVSGFGCGGIGTAGINGEDGDEGYDLDDYGCQLAPPMTKELQQKIDMNVSDAFNKRNGN